MVFIILNQKPFIVKDLKTKVYYLCMGSDNSKKGIIEKYNVLKETVAPKAFVIYNK